MDEPFLDIYTPTRRGRPRVQETSVNLSTWIPTSAYDRLVRQAKHEDTTVSKLAKRLLLKQIIPTK